MTDLNDLNQGRQDLIINDIAKHHLASTAKWAKFLAIIGFIAVVFLVLIAFAFSSIMSALPQSEMDATFAGIGGAFITVIYLLVALLYFYPTLLLYRFASRMEDGLRSSNQDLVTQAFDNQRSLYKFIGILTIITLGIYVLFILGGLLVGLAMG